MVAESESLLASSSPDAVFLRLLDGHIAYWSLGADRVYGWTAAEALGRKCHELLHTRFPVPREDIERHVLEQGEWRGRLRQCRRNGQWFVADSQWSLFHDEHGRAIGMLEVNADLQQRAAAEVRHRLRLAVSDLFAAAEDWPAAEAELLRQVAEAAGWGWGEVWDVESGRSAARFAWAQGATPVHRRFLRPGEGLLGRAWESGELQADAGDADNAALALPVTARARVVRILAWHAGPPEAVGELWQKLLAELGHQYGLMRERLQAEHALRRSELKFRSLVEAAPDALVIVDENGRIVISNRMVTELLGYSHAELEGQPVEMLIAPRLRAAHVAQRAAFSRAPKARPMGAGLDLYARRKNGTELPVEISLSPLRLDTGLLVTAVIRDLTARKREAAEAARLHTLEMEQAQHLATLGEVAAGLAHEIKNPLAGMAGALEILHEQCSGDQREIMAEVQRQIGRIGRIVEDLLHYARPRPPEFRQADLNVTVRQAAQLAARTAAPRHVRVLFQEGKLPPVTHDEDQVQRMVLNLALNGADAAPEGGAVDIRTALLPAGMAEIQVRDNGPGIPPAALPKIFRPFYTTKGGKGNGLGLPQCLRIAQLHGGSIEVSTQAGTGTTFTVRLPLQGPAAANEGAPGGAAHEA
jgi:PAS domain S-box-containing protein